MAYAPKPGSFSLFKNERRGKDTHPEYRGDGVLPDGTPAWISAWVKETREGKKFFSISIQPKEARQDEADRFRGGREGGVSGRGRDVPGSAPQHDADLADDIPF